MKKKSLKVLGIATLFLCVGCINQNRTKTVDDSMEITDDSMEIADDSEEIAEAHNPLNFISYTPIFDKWGGHSVTVQTPEGDYLYDEKDAEEYYDYYVTSFFFAWRIAACLHDSTPTNIKEYVTNNLFDIVVDLPLGNSYPNDVVEFVNEIYYNCKDAAATLALEGRGYGRSKYVYGDFHVDALGELTQYSLYLKRDKDNGGRLVIQ